MDPTVPRCAMDPTVRRFADADLDETLRVWRASRLATYTWMTPRQLHTPEEDRAFFVGVLARECEIWLADGPGGIAGLLVLRGGVVEQLFVAPDDQGRGVGSALLAHAKRLRPSGLTLFTLARNRRARAFYEKRGFVLLRFGVSAAPENEPDVFYAWRAKDASAASTV
jgi:ribosomal protein S18 acetylase RimI-like enzyme